MSPILFNFAANVFLALANAQLQGIYHPEQWLTWALALEKDTVLGVSCIPDITKATNLLKLYQDASNANTNMEKSVIVRVSNPRFLPLVGMLPLKDNEHFRHLGLYLTQKGLAQDVMEAALITSITQKNPYLAIPRTLPGREGPSTERVHIFEALVCSPCLPILLQFWKKINEITRLFLWGCDSFPVAFSVLTKRKQVRGIGLINSASHCCKIRRKLALSMFKTHKRSNHTVRAENWVVKIG